MRKRDDFKRLEDMQREWLEKEGLSPKLIEECIRKGIAVGYNALHSLKSGDHNIAIGNVPFRRLKEKP